MSVFLQQILAVLLKEVRIYRNSTIAFVFVFTGVILASLFFFIGVVTTQIASLQFMVNNLSLSLLFLTPILTMHLMSSERQRGTLEMLMTSPLSLWALILGKWISTLVLCLVLLAMCLFFPFLLSFYSNVDWGELLLCLGSIFLCFMVFSSLGLWAASFFQDRVSSVIGGIFVLLPLWLSGIIHPFIGDGILAIICQEFSFSYHLSRMSLGIVDISDVLWFLGLSAFCLQATFMRLSSYHWRMS
jgi:ABC-2 type transport system permease protein